MSIDVVIQDGDRLIIAVGPFDPGADPGPGYTIKTVADDQLPAIMSDPAYLCADDKTVGPAPC